MSIKKDRDETNSEEQKESIVKDFDVESGIILDFKRVFRGALTHYWIIGVSTLLLGLIGLGYSLSLMQTYEANSYIIYNLKNSGQTTLAKTYPLRSISLGTVVNMVTLPTHMRAVKAILGLDLTPEEIQEMITVEPPARNSSIIAIKAEADNPNLAIDLANTVAEVVVKRAKNFYQKELKDAYEYFRNQADKANYKLNQAIDDLTKFKIKYRFYIDEGQDPTSPLLTTEARLRAVEEKYNSLLVQYENLKKEAEKIPNQVESVDNPLVERIKETELALLDAKLRYAPDNPKIKRLEDTLKELKKQVSNGKGKEFQSITYEKNPLKETIEQKLFDLKIQLSTTKRLKEDLEKAYAEEKKQMQSFPQQQMMYNKLLSRKLIAQEEVSSMEGIQKSAEILMALGRGDIEVYEAAVTAQPHNNAFVKLIIPFSLAFGFLLGLGTSFVIELTDQCLVTPKEVQGAYHANLLVTIPKIKGISAKNTTTKLLSFIRQLAEHLTLFAKEKPFKALSIASTTKNEGKSLLTYSLASYYFQKNKKVLLIDFDPSANAFRKNCKLPKVTLDAYLKGKGNKKDLIAKNQEFDLITTKADRQLYENLEESKALRLFKELKTHYDLILFDLPGILDEDYAIKASKLSDALIFVISAKEVKKPLIDCALKNIEENEIPFAGIVLNKVPLIYLGPEFKKKIVASEKR